MCSSTRGSEGEKEKEAQSQDQLTSSSQRRREPCNDGWEDEGENVQLSCNDDSSGATSEDSDQSDHSEQLDHQPRPIVSLTSANAALNGFGAVEPSTQQVFAAFALGEDDGLRGVTSEDGATIKTTFVGGKKMLMNGMEHVVGGQPDNYKRLNESNGLEMVGGSKDFASFSSNCEDEVVDNHFYEGVEKLLEVWFTTSSGDYGNSDLRNIPRFDLEKLLDLVHCEIISCRKNCVVDSYVLSESSMFISKRRFILKTCGTTTPLACIPALAKLVVTNTNFDTVEDIFYSRKNFLRPDLQEDEHRHFSREVHILDQHFKDGEGYCMGSLKSSDCWFMYTLNPMDRYILRSPDYMEDPDQTIEILMSDLDPKIMSIFYKSNSTDGKDCTKKSGIDKLIPNMTIDDYLFEPCGYSMNGILDNDAKDSGVGEYMTIHITPEKQFSYVSFETNVPSSCYQQLVDRVLTTFRPGRFILTVFSTRTSTAFSYQKELQGVTRFGCWKRNHLQYSNFQSCELTYAQFVKGPS